MNIAVLGANGFIGTRLTEFLHLTKFAEVRPIVRRYSALSGLSRFKLDCRIADGMDQIALKEAFEGCDAVVHCIAGDPATILGSIVPVYQASQEAGVQRLVYISSAMVHGQNPSPGTDEESKLNMRQSLPYNNAKVRAEKMLLKLRKKGKVEIVILRPGIVYGPRSSWITNFVSDLINGRAFLVNKGNGICNSIYIDNLVHAITLALTQEDIDQEAFLLRDAEQITWADLYRPVAEYLGYNLKDIPDLPPPFKITSESNILETISNNKILKSLLSQIPKKYRFMVFSAIASLKDNKEPVSPWALPVRKVPEISLEILMLYQCQTALPWKKAYKYLDYEPVIPFSEACRRITKWMEFAGFTGQESKINIYNFDLQ